MPALFDLLGPIGVLQQGVELFVGNPQERQVKIFRQQPRNLDIDTFFWGLSKNQISVEIQDVEKVADDCYHSENSEEWIKSSNLEAFLVGNLHITWWLTKEKQKKYPLR